MSLRGFLVNILFLFLLFLSIALDTCRLDGIMFSLLSCTSTNLQPQQTHSILYYCYIISIYIPGICSKRDWIEMSCELRIHTAYCIYIYTLIVCVRGVGFVLEGCIWIFLVFGLEILFWEKGRDRVDFMSFLHNFQLQRPSYVDFFDIESIYWFWGPWRACFFWSFEFRPIFKSKLNFSGI